MFWNRKPKDNPEEPTGEEEGDVPVEYKQPKQMPDITKQREFQVGHNYDKKTGELYGFFVTDCFDDEELHSGKRPEIARFPISQLYDAHAQKLRAEKYAEYMNRINEATQKAYEQTLLVDILKDDV